MVITPLAFPIGVPELLIILAIILLLFGGARLAGLGKSTGRALREFKEETKGLREKDATADGVGPLDRPAVGPDPGASGSSGTTGQRTSDDVRKDA